MSVTVSKVRVILCRAQGRRKVVKSEEALSSEAQRAKLEARKAEAEVKFLGDWGSYPPAHQLGLVAV